MKQAKLKASTSELYEAFYTLVKDEAENEGIKVKPEQLTDMAKQLTFNLSVQDALLSEANAIVKRNQMEGVGA